ncbi:flagellar brake protein [Oceanospirillum sediminis]|uniref:Flagellar brake protein n=1 Tax=Oceanospirillum sediminis TaxID=2760088 RepID=A0A839IKY5_9GAMM|nr:flagellar brake protein [Oceanospirillum sediminis]MBB1485608.1 flagellar brake protein [Oceanospirillum sediminis]
MAALEAGGAAPDISDRKHIISRQASIFAILRSLQKHRSPLSIVFRGHDDQVYTSIVLKVDLEEGYFLLDEIAPPSGHKKAMGGAAFSVTANDRGVQVVFSGNQVVGAGTNKGAAIYKIKLPSKLLYKQRRDAFRAHIAMADQVDVHLVSYERSKPLLGSLVDISSSGCKIEFPYLVDPAFEEMEVFDELAFDLPEEHFDTSVLCAAEARHAVYDQGKSMTSCGFRFLSPDGRNQREIDRFVSYIQRESRRRGQD